MDIIMLAAGTSSRMGRTNKMLLPYNGMSMVCHCCLQALEFLQKHSEENGEKCTLIVVTGYRSASIRKAIAPCRAFIGKTGGGFFADASTHHGYMFFHHFWEKVVTFRGQG